jgi:predicted DNA-binding protein
MAVVNLRIPEEMKRKLERIAKATGASQTEMVKSAVAEKLTIHEVAKAQLSTTVPSWVPEGKFVALVRGAVAAVGDSVAEVVSATLTKFPDDPIHVARKGKPIKAVDYAFLAQAEMRCWKYVTVDQRCYPIIPTTITGRKKMVAASSPDTAASVTLVSSQIVDGAGLRPVAEETVATAAGMVKMDTFKALIGLSVGRYDAVVALSEIPRTLPFQILLGRNILDQIDVYALGKSKVICVKDP